MSYILSLDQGTTSSRALVFDADGNLRGLAQHEFTQHFPQPGWVEHDAMEIWQTQLATAREAIQNAGIAASDIAAIGISNQRETTVVWDRTTGLPLAPAIVWQDRRTAVHCDALRADGLEPVVQQKTGLLIDPYFSATKLAWLLDHTADARYRADRGELAFGTIDSWLIWRLTDGHLHITDASNASRTLLYNLHSGDWDEDLLELFRIPRSLLPTIVPSSGIVGETDPDVFGHAIPIAGIAGDQQAATFGQACLKPGMAKNTYGTGCFMLMNTGADIVASRNRLLTTQLWRIGEERGYALEGSVFMGGAVVQWLRDGLGLIGSAAEIEQLAMSVPDCGGVILIPAFTGLGAPWWKAEARGTILGMSRGTTRAHIARAALDAIALQCADVLVAMQQDAPTPLTELRVDGGAARNDLLMQRQADLLGVPVVRPRQTETTALGAACLAGLGCGLWPDREVIAARWQEERRFEPRLSEAERGASIVRWQAAVRHTIAWEGAA
ncbi:MAG: glycerol kinase GlpK [Rhodocyclaceae bacterium]|nr:glycerol kinase GlpK [Rhodocyclaceae bacterium]